MAHAINNRRLATAIVAAFIADIVFYMLFHDSFMMPAYTETLEMWRSEEDILRYSGYRYLGHLILVSIAGIIFARGYEKKDIMEGFRFGLLIGLLMASQTVVAFAYSPIPDFLFTGWLVGNLMEGVIIGLMLAMVYRIKPAGEKAARVSKAPKKKAKSKKK